MFSNIINSLPTGKIQKSFPCVKGNLVSWTAACGGDETLGKMRGFQWVVWERGKKIPMIQFLLDVSEFSHYTLCNSGVPAWILLVLFGGWHSGRPFKVNVTLEITLAYIIQETSTFKDVFLRGLILRICSIVFEFVLWDPGDSHVYVLWLV